MMVPEVDDMKGGNMHSPPSAPPIPHANLYQQEPSVIGVPVPPPSPGPGGSANNNNNNNDDDDEQVVEDGRQEFSNYAEFFLTSVGYCVGLGNLVVYPGRVYNHGGGAFIVAYFVFVLVLGVPLYMHDLKVGQFFRKGAYGSFSEMSPLLAGTGLAHVLIASIMIAYFNVIIGWAAIYLYHSFFDPLPWEGDTRTFFYQEVCGASDGLGDVNRIVWPVFGANAAAWLLTCIVLIKGVSSGGKVVYVTVTLPYLCIAALIARGATLPGGPEGIKEYLNVDVEKLQDVTTWVRAANQVFYSVGVAMGAIVTFGSYQQRKNASYARDGFIIPVINGLTSFLGGFAIFPMLGHIAQNTGLGIEDLDLSGFGVTFIAYTEGLASLPRGWAQAFSAIFFLMIITLGVDTQIGVAETVITFARETRAMGSWPEPLVTAVVCLGFWAISLPCVTDGGYYWVTLLWDYGNYMSMFIVAGVGLVGSCYLAGTAWHHEASQRLRGKRENALVLLVWRTLNPALCFVLFGLAAAGLSPYPTTLGAHGPGTGVFPTWAQVLSGLINFGPSLLVVVGLLLPLVFRARGGDGGGQSGGSAKEVELPMVPTPLKRRTSKKYESLDEV